MAGSKTKQYNRKDRSQHLQLLTDIYDNQERITKAENEIAHILLSRELRTAPDNRITLILLPDSYKGWAIDRAPALLIKYQKAIDKL